MATNRATLKLVSLLGDCLEMYPCGYCGREGDGREECAGCGAPPATECVCCGWRSRGWCDAAPWIRCFLRGVA